MLVIKLRMIGKKRQHSFRIVVQEKRSKLQGAFTDDLGWFNPHTNQVKINQERLKYWLDNGAQLTESMEKVIKHAKDSSGVESFVGRTKAKKKKKEKLAEKNPPQAAAPETEAPGTEAVEATPTVEVSNSEAVADTVEPKEEA